MHDEAPSEVKTKSTELSGFKIKIELPKLCSGRKIDLDVSDQRLKLHAEGFYHLDFAFPRKVVGEKGTAKFDKKTHTLVVTVPVKPKKCVPVVENTVEKKNVIQTSIETEKEMVPSKTISKR